MFRLCLVGSIGWLCCNKVCTLKLFYSQEKSDPIFYVGERKEQLPFMSYSDSLYLPDNSVKAFRQGIVDNSKLAADIGIAILFDIYGDDMKYEYPFTVAKFYSDWTIEGTLPEGVLGGVGHITLMRSDGMVSFYIHEK